MKRVSNNAAIIFDFDGTLADTEGLLREIYNEVAVKKKWERLNNRQYRKLFTATIGHVLRWSRLRPWRFFYLVRQSRKHLHTEAGRISLFKGLPKLINDLHEAGYDLYVLSNNVSVTINLVLTHREVIDKLIILEQPVFLRKHVRINELIRRKNYARSNVWMVGDERRDIVAAKKARVNSIAVTWGLQNLGVLKKSHPTHLVNNPSEILKILDSKTD